MFFIIGASESIMSCNKTHHNTLLHQLFVYTFILIFAHFRTLLGQGHFTTITGGADSNKRCFG